MNHCLIPVCIYGCDQITITSIKELNQWLFIQIQQGQVIQQKLYKTKEEVPTPIDYIIVCNPHEDIELFLYKGITVLITSTQRTIPEILEAFIFKELDTLTLD